MEEALTVGDLLEILKTKNPNAFIRVKTEGGAYDGGPDNFAEDVSGDGAEIVLYTFTDPEY